MRRRTLASVIVGIVVTLGLAYPARAQSPDPEFRADIERLLEITGTTKIAGQMASITASSLIAGVKRTNPNIPDRAITVVQEVLDAEFAKMFTGPDGVMPEMVELYAKHFTHDDVLAMLAFYRSPVGQKAITVMPALVQEGSDIGQRWAQKKMPEVANALQQRLRTEGFIP